MNKPNSLDSQLSYSSSQLLQGCQRKFWYYKVVKVDKDTDVEDDKSALNIGLAFHKTLETLNHNPEGKILEALVPAIKECGVEDHQAMLHAMVLKYLKSHKSTGLEVIKCELEINTETYKGFIDAIARDENGLWVIDLKTTSRFSETTAKRLTLDRQLNLYAAHRKVFQELFNLPFKGVSYRVITKPTLKQKASEEYKDFVLRCFESCKVYDVRVPLEALNPEHIMRSQDKLNALAQSLYKLKAKKKKYELPLQNFGYCDSYYKPCEYWSRCYGKLYSETIVEILEV